nr:MAG TPA: hypothetical protein [Caudoviricetes sp.]
MNINELRERAAEILVCTPDKMEEKEILDGNAFYFLNSDRGGGALIISFDGEMLLVDPFFADLEKHILRFVSGERSHFD